MEVFSERILTTTGQDIEKWRSLVNKNPKADVYFTPEYAKVFEATKGETREAFGGEAQLFFYGNEQNYIIYPVFKRRISELPFSPLLPPESGDWFDIVSPYGYSGPLAYISEPKIERSLWQSFGEEFHSYCLQSNIVTEFTRLHPYIENHLALQKFPGYSIRKSSEVVYIDLHQDEPLIRKNMTKGNKSSVSKARRSGVEILSSKAKDDIATFHQLYTHTMERSEAKRAYFFPMEFFNNTLQLLGDNIELFSAWYEGQMIAASLFLFKGNLVHYYLSGSDASFLSVCPNNLLLYEVILWAKEQGYKIFNLGGGYQSNDSLFCFKSSFSKTAADFYTYSRVHNEEIYEILCQAGDKYDRMTGKEAVSSDYFPKYRR